MTTDRVYTRIITASPPTGVDHFLRRFDLAPDAIFTEAARDDLSFDDAFDEAAFLELLDDGAVLDDAPVLEDGVVFDDLDDGAVFEADFVAAATVGFSSGFSFVFSALVFAVCTRHTAMQRFDATCQ